MTLSKYSAVSGYNGIHAGIVELLESARRAEYGERLIERLAVDLTKRFGRAFGMDSIELMHLLFRTYRKAKISESAIRNFTPNALATAFPMRESNATTARDQDSVGEQKRGNQ